MRKNFRNVGFYPQPVLVVGTYDQDGIPDAMNVGWGGLVGGTYVELNISRGHKTTENIRQNRAFTLSFADQANLVAAAYVGPLSYTHLGGGVVGIDHGWVLLFMDFYPTKQLGYLKDTTNSL